jgi:N-acetylmuramoyl-L-alanine amidase CwlA
MPLNVTKNLVPVEKYAIKCPYAMAPEGITVHNTANDASAFNEISYMTGNIAQVSFHYAVDDMGAVQGLPLDRNGWHAGDGANGYGNRKTIGVEICYSKSGGARFAAAERNAQELMAWLMRAYGWTPADLGGKRISTHKARSGKDCPHRTLPHIGAFWQGVAEAYANPPSEAPPPPSMPYLARVSASTLNVRALPSLSSRVNAVIKAGGVYTVVDEQKEAATGIKWLKLKSGAGWVSSGYMVKI